jgi:hypothetical protein
MGFISKITRLALLTVFIGLFLDETSLANHWNRETVDTSPNVGMYVSMKLDPNPPHRAHISYFDAANKRLKYARQGDSPDTWHVETVDNSGEWSSIAVDSKGRPHISYYDRPVGRVIQSVKYAVRVGERGNCGGGAWSCTVVDTFTEPSDDVLAEGGTSIALGPMNTVHISYYDPIKSEVKRAMKTSDPQSTGCTAGGWSCLVIEKANGDHIAIAVDSDDRSFIVYNDSGGHLTLARELESPVIKLTPEFADLFCGQQGQGSSARWFFSCDIIPNSLPQKGTDLINGNASSITLGPGEAPHVVHISLYDPEEHDDFLVYARRKPGSKWEQGNVATVSVRRRKLSESSRSSIALDANGTSAYISYQAEDGSLRYVRTGSFSEKNGFWEVAETDEGPIDDRVGARGRGSFSSIQARPLERPVVAYYDDTARILRFATQAAD